MFILKFFSILFLIFFYILLSSILHIIKNIFLRKSSLYRILSLLTRFITNNFNKILGIKVKLTGELSLLKERGCFIISNHLSYIDGLVLASIFPVIFVSKLSVKFWPIFGQMAWLGGTVFVDRQSKKKAPYSLKKMIDVLNKRTNLLLFPEGTSTDGTKILEFQSIFFQVPFEAKSSVIPITIQYLNINGQELSLLNRDKVFWYGQKKFFLHFLSLLKLKNITAKVIIHPKIEINPLIFKNRKELSHYCREIILESFSPVIS